MVEQIIFYIFSGVLLGSALAVITSRNPVHSALFLVLAFFNMAVLWLLLHAEFLGIALVLVYVGAVMVLFVFVVMMLDINLTTLRSGFASYAPLGVLVAAIVVAEIGYVVWSRNLGLDFMMTAKGLPTEYSNTVAIGQVMYTDYVYPFEIASVILLVGIVAAIALTLRRREGTRHQDPAWQVKVRSQDRVRLVRMSPEEKR
ncbi:MAG: NADH-quinone oxidoreductase subunit J [Gammaproteobacteria bacterium]|jgi:NADH-quinone oxidoreductase subunit J